jgi:hypothetical protein
MHSFRRIAVAFAISASACAATDAPPLTASFEVIQDQPINNGSIREVYVRIDEPIAEEQVRAVAVKVKNAAYSSCPKTKVWFLLPSQRIGSGAWASATFRPELEVMIIGAHAETHHALETAVTAAKGEVLGQWIWDIGSLAHKITLIKRGDAVVMRKTFVDTRGRSVEDEKPVEILGPNKYRYPGSETTWMRINPTGALEFHDRDGGMDSARPVK